MSKRSVTGQERSHVRAFAERRREAGLCLHRAAARLRISPGYLRGLERGRVPLSLPLAQRMAAEYGTTVRDLIRPAESREKGRGGQSEEVPPAH